MSIKEFKKYQHVERFGTDETEGIEDGECYVFPKLDGTNASVWLSEGKLCCGSRSRQLTLDNDNAGFCAWAMEQENLLQYLAQFPTHRLFGEWLVPHTLKTYREDAWRRFYVFDVCEDKGEEELLHQGDSHFHYFHYDTYVPGLEAFGIDYTAPIAIVQGGNAEQFANQLQKNVFLIEDGKGIGEGVVIKRYDYRNKFGRPAWAKIITSEFKEQHVKAMGAPIIKGTSLVEKKIVDRYVTGALVEKEFSKIVSEVGWVSKSIPRLLNTVYHALITEESWNFIKEHKRPTIDFGKLQRLCFAKVKEVKPEIFI